MNENYFEAVLVDKSNRSVVQNITKQYTLDAIPIFWAIYGLILFTFGILGNVLVICVLHRESFISVVSTFMTALAIFSILILATGIPVNWVNAVFGYRPQYPFEICLYHRWVLAFCQSSANWLLVLVTAVRLLYLNASVRRLYRGFTIIKARVSIVLLVILMMIFEYIMLHLRNIDQNKYRTPQPQDFLPCKIDMGTREALIRNSIVTFLPCFFLFLLTICLIKDDTTQQAGEVSRTSIVSRRRSIVQITNNIVNDNFTRMLTLTNVQFLVTNLPLALYSATGFQLYDSTTTSGRAYNSMVYTLLHGLLYTGFAASVIIYCLSGKRFKTEMKELLISLFYKRKDSDPFERFPVTSSDPHLFLAFRSSSTSSKKQSSSEIFPCQERLSSTEV